MSNDPAARVGDQDQISKSIEFKLVLETGAGGDTDLMRVEELVGLHFQDLLYDESFTTALQPKEFITSTVSILGNKNG
jgi:hypothetical protein